jgi:hypothetical protein
MYSRILTEKKKSKNSLTNLKIEIIEKLSSLYSKLFNPILKQVTQAISRATKIQLIFDGIILVGIAYIIHLLLKILKNQNIQQESLVLTETINFNSIAGTVAKIAGTIVGFILLVDGILFMTAFFKGYFTDTEFSIVGYDRLAQRVTELLWRAKERGEIKQVERLEKLRDRLSSIHGTFVYGIAWYANKKRKEYEEAHKDSNAFVKFFKTFGAVIRALKLEEWFNILAAPVVLASMPLRMELPVAFERLKARIMKSKEEPGGSEFTLELVHIKGYERDLSDHIFLLNGKTEVTDKVKKEDILSSYNVDFPAKMNAVVNDDLTISRNKNRVFMQVSVKDKEDTNLYIIYIFKIDKLDAKGIKDIIDIIKSYANKYDRKIVDQTLTLSEIGSALRRMYNVEFDVNYMI